MRTSNGRPSQVHRPCHGEGTLCQVSECFETNSIQKVKGKGSCLESILHDNACSTDFTFPLARWAPTQRATIDPTLDLCTRYPLRLGGPRQCGIQSLPDTSTHGQHWELNPRPSDLESNALSTRLHAPKLMYITNSRGLHAFSTFSCACSHKPLLEHQNGHQIS